MTGKYILEVEGASQQYFDQSEKSFQVLNNINLQIREGEFVTIVGPTGCGKSTLLRMILGSERPSAGNVLMDQKPILKPDRNRGVVFQKYSLFDNLTVRQNVRIGLELENFSIFGNLLNTVFPGWKYEEYSTLVDEYLERVGLLQHGDKYPYQLSGGMRQRVAIAQAMIMKPKVLLMDEPFGALDAGTKDQMHAFMLEQWQQTGQTILFVTHDLEEAVYLGTRVIVLSQYYQGANGAKIVKDFNTPWPHPRDQSVKEEELFQDMIKTIRNQGLNSNYLLNQEEFDLSHADAIQLAS
ncbi:ABC transporter ATP-binding protein [Adhaeribacter aquaticus]|uniref:ABC transporter ATP-binding protein n=1 Tax=Adhaeribacter aquaticus TaxID=299567 RepID=UPI00041F3D24|nr:ABC transporter ATP-binding protein [Adhaeribacter aquaticus]